MFKEIFHLHPQNAALEVSSENCHLEDPLATDLHQILKIYIINCSNNLDIDNLWLMLDIASQKLITKLANAM